MGTLRRLRRISHTPKSRFESIPWGPLPHVRKMSEVLLEFAAPILEDLDDRYFESAIAFSALCWNLALLRSEDQRTQLSDVIKVIAESDLFKRREIQPYVRMLLDRKNTLFADDKRLIINHKIIEEAAGPRLLVMSSPLKDGNIQGS